MLHRTATLISALLAIAAIFTLGLAAYQAATHSGEWANDYWFNHDWWRTAPLGLLAAVAAVAVYLTGRVIRYLLSRE